MSEDVSLDYGSGCNVRNLDISSLINCFNAIFSFLCFIKTIFFEGCGKTETLFRDIMSALNVAINSMILLISMIGLFFVQNSVVSRKIFIGASFCFV